MRSYVTHDARRARVSVMELDADQRLECVHGEWFVVLEAYRGPKIRVGPLTKADGAQLDLLLRFIEQR